jgi:two-component system, OmpR family, sensor histidine kinase KdpD
MLKHSGSLYSFLYRHLVVVILIIAVTFLILPFRTSLELQLIVLIYLLPIMLSTVLWGLTPGIVASFLAFLAFNYFFIEPFHTFRVHATLDLITLIIFLIFAVVMSQLIGRAREGTRIAKQREWDAVRMYELISGLAGAHETAQIAEILAGHTSLTFNCRSVEVVLPDGKDGSPEVIGYPGQVPRESAPTFTIPLTTPRGQEGELRLWRAESEFNREETRLMEAFGSQGALALERVRLTKGENKARFLEESDRIKTSLLNSVSHELRSPLAAIKASVSSLRSGAIDWEMPARNELLETVEEETDHLNLLVGNLLDMSRIEAGALSPHLRWNSIGEIVRGVATKMRKQLQGYPLEIDLPEELPFVPSDYVMMEQVFTNLLSNSIKYALHNSRITISGMKEPGGLHILMTNQGPSVPEEQLERIFDKFTRVTDADRITGTGLGLSICKGIIEAHHGKIWAENRAGGIAFHILLPTMKDGASPELPKEE